METLLNSLVSLILLVPTNISLRETTQTPNPAPPTQNGALPSVSPNGSFIVFYSNRTGTDDLFVMQANGTGQRQLTHTAEREGISGWTPDSKHILFSVFKDGSSAIYQIDLDGRNQKLIGTVSGRSVAISPNAKRLFYASGSWTEMSLFLADIDGKNPRLVNDGKSIVWNTRWSPDGKSFAFTSRNGPSSELAVFVANVDGSSARQLSHIPLEEGAAQSPAWSRDGKQLAIQVDSRVKKGLAHIWIIDANTGEGRKLAEHDRAYIDETPSWFPDGKRIAFQSDRTGRMEVWIMNIDGKNSRQLTH